MKLVFLFLLKIGNKLNNITVCGEEEEIMRKKEYGPWVKSFPTYDPHNIISLKHISLGDQPFRNA